MRLLIVMGPPAVGKMTVGRAVAERSGFRLFHNHHTIEMLLDVFDYGTPPFTTLNQEFRQRVMQEAAAAGTDLVFTFVMGMDDRATPTTSRTSSRRTAARLPSSSWSPTSTPGWPATAPSTGSRRRSPSATSSGRTATSVSSRRATG